MYLVGDDGQATRCNSQTRSQQEGLTELKRQPKKLHKWSALRTAMGKIMMLSRFLNRIMND